MRKTGSRGHDPRQLDLLAVIFLLVIVLVSWRFYADSTATPRNTTALIEPSQTVHW